MNQFISLMIMSCWSGPFSAITGKPCDMFSTRTSPFVSFNSIKAVAFDLAKRGNNENFLYVLADYGAGN